MKDHYDFSKGKRGRILPPAPEDPGKIKISIRIDEDLYDAFMTMADKSGGAVGYQTLINGALRAYIEGKAPKLEDTLRRIIREELKGAA
jgi:uncharacterized protein (DUF4415 family)